MYVDNIICMYSVHNVHTYTSRCSWGSRRSMLLRRSWGRRYWLASSSSSAGWEPNCSGVDSSTSGEVQLFFRYGVAHTQCVQFTCTMYLCLHVNLFCSIQLVFFRSVDDFSLCSLQCVDGNHVSKWMRWDWGCVRQWRYRRLGGGLWHGKGSFNWNRLPSFYKPTGGGSVTEEGT